MKMKCTMCSRGQLVHSRNAYMKYHTALLLSVSAPTGSLCLLMQTEHKSPDMDQKTVVLNCVKMQGKIR